MGTCRRAIRYFSADRWLIAGLVVLVGVSFLIAIIQAWPVPVLIDLVFSPVERTDWLHRAFIRFLPAGPLGRIVAIAVLGLGLKIATDVTFLIGRTMLNNKIRYNGLARVRLALYGKLQHLSLDFHRNRPQGDTIYRLSTDTQGFFGILDTLVGAGISCVTVIAMTVIMLTNSVPLTLMALSVVPPLVVTNVLFSRAIKRRAEIAKQCESDFTTTVQRSMGAIALIQSFCRHASDFATFKSSVDTSNRTNMRLDWLQSLYPLTVQLIFGVGAALIFGCGGYMAYRDQILHPISNGVTIGDLLAFMYYVTQLSDPLNRITGFRAAIQNNVAAANRVLYVLDTPLSIKDPPDAKALPRRSRTISLNNVSFAYPSAPVVHPPTAMRGGPSVQGTDRLVLHGIQATITPGQFVAFVGPSGAGKSTLFSLLPRFYDPVEGSVRLDGHDIRSISVSDLRQHIACVQQESPLFPGTIAENIRFARPEASRAEVVEAARAAGADEFIGQLEGGYDTMISESAANLSGGQRQRLALARALLADAPILILDEPTSAQDPHHAAGILQTLHSLRGTRTILLVTHDLSLVEHADQLFVLQHGRLVESGTHTQLVAKQGLYHGLLNAVPTAEATPALHIAS